MLDGDTSVAWAGRGGPGGQLLAASSSFAGWSACFHLEARLMRVIFA